MADRSTRWWHPNSSWGAHRLATCGSDPRSVSPGVLDRAPALLGILLAGRPLRDRRERVLLARPRAQRICRGAGCGPRPLPDARRPGRRGSVLGPGLAAADGPRRVTHATSGVVGILAHLMVIRASRLAPSHSLPRSSNVSLWGIIRASRSSGDVPDRRPSSVPRSSSWRAVHIPARRRSQGLQGRRRIRSMRREGFDGAKASATPDGEAQRCRASCRSNHPESIGNPDP